jgi:hypothetical protein
MKRFSMATALLTTLLLIACSGGGGDSLAGGPGGGIGGTGIAASGQISGFGSVFVNGIEFETTNATISIDDVPGLENDLRVGMIVDIRGTLNDDGLTGNADTIVHEAELKGPVTSEPISDTDQRFKSFRIFDFEVIAEADVTIFDSSSGTFSFGTIALDDVVEVNGFFDPATNIVHASRIERLENLLETETRLRGLVANFDSIGNTFDIGTVMVTVAPGTDLSGLPTGLANDLEVKVEGVVLANGTVEAREIELDSSPFEGESGEASVQGVIEDFVSNADFKVSGVPVNATNAQIEPAGTTLQEGLLVQVEGNLVNGVLDATELKLREGSIELVGFVATTPGTDTFPVEFTSGAADTITVRVDNATQITDGSGGDAINFAQLAIGDMVRVKGIENGGQVLAETVRRKPEDEVELKGPLGAFDPNGGAAALGTLTILGVAFDVDANTKFELDGVLDQEVTRVDFFNNLDLVMGAIVEVQDEVSANGVNDADGIAEDVELDSGVDDFDNVQVEVEGNLDAFNDNGDGTGTVTVNGNQFEIDATTELLIEDAMGVESTTDFATFFATIQVGNLMKIKDRDPVDGIADRARLDLNP